MPDRVLADSLISSESASHLTDAAERLFLRIIAAPTTDNWGRRSASLSQLRADCIPLLGWTDEKLLEALEQIVEHKMIQVYVVTGRTYLAVANWDRFQRRAVGLRSRHGISRIPAPPEQRMASAEHEPAARGAPPNLGLPVSAMPRLISTALEPALRLPQTTAFEPTEGQEQDLDQSLQRQVLDLSLRVRVAREAGVDWRMFQGMERFRALAGILHGADERTPLALNTVAGGLPEAAIHAALESLEKRRQKSPPLVSEARYVVATLASMRDQGTYKR